LKREAPAAARNSDPIAAVLRDVLPGRGTILEVASGTGEHAVHFARAFPGLLWQPTDRDDDALASIAAWRKEAARPNLLDPLLLDASEEEWPSVRADAILCINMVHISPWSATEGLIRGAAQLLRTPGAPLILYGPYRRAEVPTAPSNEAFDASLKSRNPDWGLRDVAHVQREAEANGFFFDRLAELPANNIALVFRRD
jgi:hypothetical protein